MAAPLAVPTFIIGLPISRSARRTQQQRPRGTRLVNRLERALRARYDEGATETGLFDTALGFVVMDNVDGAITFA